MRAWKELERFFSSRRKGRENPDVVSSPQRIPLKTVLTIDIAQDPLRSEPRRPKYVAEWNVHVSSEEAVALQRRLDASTETVEELLKTASLEQLRDARIEAERNYALMKLNTPVLEDEMRMPVREARAKENRMRKSLRAQRRARESLRVFHEAWVLAGEDESRVLFYAADHLVGNRSGREDLFVRFVEGHSGSPFELGGLFEQFDSVVKRRIYGKAERSEYEKRGKRMWQKRHPGKKESFQRNPERREEQQPASTRSFAWLVAEDQDPILVGSEHDATLVLKGMDREQLEMLRMTRLRSHDVFNWLHLSDDELVAGEVIEEGTFRGWRKVPRGKQWELLFYQEENNPIMVHLRRLPEGVEWV